MQSVLLNLAAKCVSAIAKPTAFEIPAPRGPAVTSTPSVSNVSGCPGVFDHHCLNSLISSMETD